jgi:hypothetical protein
VKKSHVIVIRHEGPVGGPGMREMLSPTSAVMGKGLGKDVALITDGRFSGGSHGFVVGHITPEAALGGPLAVVKNGDPITIDANKRALTLDVPEAPLHPRCARQICKASDHREPGCGDGLSWYDAVCSGWRGVRRKERRHPAADPQAKRSHTNADGVWRVNSAAGSRRSWVPVSAIFGHFLAMGFDIAERASLLSWKGGSKAGVDWRRRVYRPYPPSKIPTPPPWHRTTNTFSKSFSRQR